MRKLGILTTLALVLAVAGPLAAQDKQDKRDNKGGLVLGTGPQKLHGTVVVTEGSTFVLRTDDQRTYRVDAAYLAANQPATLYYEQGSRQEIVGVWIQPGTGQPAASQQNTPPPASAPSASVSSPQSVEGLTVDTSGVDRQALRAIGPGDVVVVTGNGTSTPDRFVAQSVQPRR